MTTIPDSELYTYAHRAKGKVVLVTGAANGIGKETVKQFAKYGAKVVIGDLDPGASEKVAQEIRQAGGEAIAAKCDVASWDDQVALFEAADKAFGRVDVVIPNAGIGEFGNFEKVNFGPDGRPTKPNLKTVHIDLTGVLYTVHLGLHYLQRAPERDSLRAIVLIGSMASWQAVTGGPLYAATKHAVLGLMRSLYPPCRAVGVRIGVVHPWFSPTAIIKQMPGPVGEALDGIPMTPVWRVAGAIVRAASDPDPSTSGRAWMLPDDQPLLVLAREQLREGVYRLLDDKLKARIRESQRQKAKL